jgi:hypothetical protein
MFTSSLRAFYLLNRLDFPDFVTYFLCVRGGLVQAVWGRRSNPCSERKPIVHRVPEVLLAAEVTFCSLHRRVAQQKLNLLQFAATRVA